MCVLCVLCVCVVCVHVCVCGLLCVCVYVCVLCMCALCALCVCVCVLCVLCVYVCVCMCMYVVRARRTLMPVHTHARKQAKTKTALYQTPDELIVIEDGKEVHVLKVWTVHCMHMAIHRTSKQSSKFESDYN